MKFEERISVRSDNDCTLNEEVTVDFVVSTSKILGDEFVDEVISFDIDVGVSEELVSVPGILSIDNSGDDKSLEDS